MLKKTITYVDFNGETVTEDHFFHISQAELVEMEVSQQGGYQKYLEMISTSKDNARIYHAFTAMLKTAYGKKSDDGRRFIKTEELWNDFVSSEAYSTLLMGFFVDPASAAEFLSGMIPAGLDDVAAKMKKMVESEPEPIKPQLITQKEAREMDPRTLGELLTSGQARFID